MLRELVARHGRARRGARAPVVSRWARCVADRRPQLVDALAGRRGGGDHRRPPVAGVGEVEHALEVAAGVVDARAVGLVDDEDVGDLEEPGLVRLDGVPPAGVHDDDRGVGGPRHLDLDLADADRLDHDPRPPGRVEHPDGLERGERQAAEVARGSPSSG